MRRHTQRLIICVLVFFFSSRRRHTRCLSDWSSDVCSSDLIVGGFAGGFEHCRETAANEIVHLILGSIVRKTLQELGEVLLAVKVIAAFRGVVNVPGHLFQLIESREEIRGLAKG